MLSWTDGLPLGLPPADPRHDIFAHFVLDGSQRMITYGVPPAGSGWGVPLWDVSVIGRDISRPYNSNWGMQSGLQVLGSGVVPQGYGLEPAIMAGVGGPRAAEFAAFGQLLNGTATPAQGAAALLGNRVFSVADYVRHASAAGSFARAAPVAPGVGWMASVRMASVRTARCESGNGENLLGQHLSDGAIFLYVTGYEYVDAFPAWDWQRVPGTSVLPFSTTSMAPGGQGTTAFVGGASDGAVGSAVLDVSTRGNGEGLQMRRSAFFFDDVYVVLGANATAPPQHAGLPLWTSIAQRRLSATGVFTSDSGGQPLAAGINETLPASTWWVWEGGVGVFFLPAACGAAPRAPLRVSSVLVANASWASIGAESDNVSVALFTLTLEQAPPVDGGSASAFAYVVAPNLPLEDFTALATTLAAPAPAGLTVVRNDGGAQAVLHGPAGVMQAAVFELDAGGGGGGSASLDGGAPGWRAAVDAPGAFVLRADAAHLSFTAASPTQGGAWAVRLSLDRAVAPGSGGGAANSTCGGAPWAVALLSPAANGSSTTAVCSLA
jgi:chondroitin AC lyase